LYCAVALRVAGIYAILREIEPSPIRANPQYSTLSVKMTDIVYIYSTVIFLSARSLYFGIFSFQALIRCGLVVRRKMLFIIGFDFSLHLTQFESHEFEEFEDYACMDKTVK
jgi:hypothetical protein